MRALRGPASPAGTVAVVRADWYDRRMDESNIGYRHLAISGPSEERSPMTIQALPQTPWGGTLIVYFSSHGHTAMVAQRLAETLLKGGLAVDLRDAAHAGDVDPVRHDVVVVGASLHREPDRREIV